MSDKKEKSNSKMQKPNSKNGTTNIEELVIIHNLSIAKRKQRKAHIVMRTANDEYKQLKNQLA